MVIRTVVSGARAVSGHRSRSFVAALVAVHFAFAPLAVAQVGNSPTPSPAPAATPTTPVPQAQNPAPVQKPEGPAATPQNPAVAAPALTFARVVNDKVALRCWSGAVASPPVFEETLAKDAVVAVGRSENGFRAVQLPLGPLGFVSKKFTEASPEGVVKTKGSKVAFRYRARSSEAPVTQLDDGTTLQVVGEQDDWYRVRVAGVEAWVAEAEVAVGDQADPALATAWADLQGKQAAEVKARLDAIATQRAREVQDAADLAAVQVVTDAFADEKKKEVAEQKHAPLVEALDKLKGTLASGSAALPAIESLKKRIETQQWIVEASAAIITKPPVVDAPPPEVKDPLERFQSIGWLRYERRLAGPGIYFLEKGGQRLYVLSCTNGRYDLGLFVDHEVAIGGPRRRPVQESLSVLDIERLEVLGTPIQ